MEMAKTTTNERIRLLNLYCLPIMERPATSTTKVMIKSSPILPQAFAVISEFGTFGINEAARSANASRGMETHTVVQSSDLNFSISLLILICIIISSV